MNTSTKILALSAILALCSSVLANEQYVPGQVDYGERIAPVKRPPGLILVDMDANGANDGSSWPDAYNYLQDALADANVAGHDIWVAEGTYYPDADSSNPGGTGKREATFALINGLGLYGGFPPGGGAWQSRDPNVYKTVLTGDINTRNVDTDNSYNVVTASGTDPNTILDGFTITAGNANGDSCPHWAGGGMYNSGVLNLTNCTFTGNWAEGGGGIYSTEDSDVTLLGCTFSGNYAVEGGGMYNSHGNATLLGCIFSGNDAFVGGGILNFGHSTLTNCTFTGNRATYGGGLADDTISSTTLTNCTFRGNSADRQGGGMYQRGEATLTNCAFSSNDAIVGGGMYTRAAGHPALTNCTFSGNWARHIGGGMRCEGKITLLTNCTFSGNWAVVNGGGMSCSHRAHRLTNSIFWGNTPNQITGSTVLTSYSDIQGGWLGEGNIDADPCFLEAGYWDVNDVWVDGDYHLWPGSPCIDAGDPNYIPEPNETDLDGNPRIVNGRIDMGAYEYTPPVEAVMHLTPQKSNCRSKRKHIKAHITLPEGFLAEDLDANEPAIAEPMDVESESIKVLGPDKIEIAFDRQAFCDALTETGEVEVTVTGSFIDGQYFSATDTVRIISR
jgi:predicted outer membrane repeat protein